jgi:O-antigen/teichoic acid export membrane protein
MLFQARLVMQYDALVTVLVQALDTVLILWLISQHANLVSLLAAPVFSGALGALLTLAIARRRFRLRLGFELARVFDLLKEAWPVGLTVLLAVVYLKADSVLLGVLAHPEDVGVYGAAYKPIEYLILASSVLINPVFPLLARWQGVDTRRFTLVFQRATTALLAFLLPVPVVLALIADPLVQLLYSAEFAGAATPLRLLAIAMVFVTFAVWQDFTLLSVGRQRFTLAYGAVGVALNIALNVLIIPRAGAIGAASVAVLTAMLFSMCASWGCWHFARLWPAPRPTAGLLAANVALGAALWVLLRTGLAWPVATAAATLLYPALLLLLGVTSLRELRELLPRPRSSLSQPILETA